MQKIWQNCNQKSHQEPRMTIKIYHNPRCSKSRETLGLLVERGLEPIIVEYLKQPPTVLEIKQVLGYMGKSPRDIMRKGEAAYKEQNLGDENLSDDALIEAMVQTPILIERPIVIAGGKAALGRPPESVLDIL
jgi:arsenate reductase (glutaredoxin)